MDLHELIKLAKTISKPYIWAIGILSILLLASTCGNIYQATRSYDVVIEQENNESDNNINGVIK